MNIFDTSKSLIENVYLLSGPILAIFGFSVIRQIKLAKDQLKTAKDQLLENQKQLVIISSRDAIKTAAEQVKFYMDTIVKYANEASDKIKEIGITRIEIQTTRFIKQDILNDQRTEEIISYMEKSDKMLLFDLNLMNSLETFSTYFTQKVADETVAFQSVGRSFCHTVEKISFRLSSVRDNETDYFKNTVSLYNLWKTRLTNQDLEIQKETLQKELEQKLQEIEAKKTNTSIIKPLGTDN